MTPERELELLAAIALKDEALSYLLTEKIDYMVTNKLGDPSAEHGTKLAAKALSTPQDLSALHAYGKRIADAVERLTVERCAENLSRRKCGSNQQRFYVGMCEELIRALPLGQIDIEELGK